MGGYPTGPEECAPPECEPRVTSLRDPGPIAVFVFWAAMVAYVAMYFLFKLWRTRRHHMPSTRFELVVHNSNESPPTAKHKKEGLRDEETFHDTRIAMNGRGQLLHVTGYKDSIAGLIGYSLCCLFSLSCAALLILVLWDYYSDCQVSGIDGLCFYGDYFIFGTFDFNSKIMFVVWWVTAVWFFAWVTKYGQVRNWFREVCDLGNASTVYVWVPAEIKILTANASPLVWLMRQAKARAWPLAFQGQGQTLNTKKTHAGLQYFEFEGMRFIVSGGKTYRASLTVGSCYMDFHQACKGLDAAEAGRRLDLLGSNAIHYKATSWIRLFVDESFRLFHVYQYLMYTLSMWNSYLFVASLDVFIVLLAGLISIVSARRSQKAIEKVTKLETPAEVVRGGQWQVVPSAQLVPGDVIRVCSSWLLPCDCVLVQGSCICNEANLSGEAMPVQKRQCPTNDTAYDVRGEGSRYTLFSSTTVLQAGTNGSDEVLAVVTATGMATSRGQLMSSIIFPAPMVFKYDEELPIVVALMVLYAIPCAVCTIAFQYHNGSYSQWVTKFVYCMGVINQCLNPLLPVVLTVGDVQAVRRLKTMGILCLDPGRVAISGKIRLFALDKTGTLTQAWLHLLGVQPVQSANAHPTHAGTSMDAVQYLDKAGHIQTHPNLLWGLATCHAISTSEAGGLVGNQVEVNMFSSTGWQLIETSGQAARVEHAGQRLTIVRVNQFEHARRSMSVVALDESTGKLHVFCKGSFERMGEIVCQESVPSDYLQTGEEHASDGCYVLAMAHRCLGVVPVHQVAAVSRDELEAGLDLLALLLFRNELKPDTAEAINQLKDGQVRPIMVTGDSAHCAAYIGRACGMVAQHADLLLADINSSGDVNWSLMGSNRQDAKLHISFTTAQVLAMQTQPRQKPSVELAITGAAFDKLQQSEAMEQLLFFTRIFARFAPQQKAEVVSMQQRAGLVVGMCGDGSNDCAALRAAHAGLALSDAEASLVSPFTSSNKSISSAVELIREGRCALHTRLACYKFLITYGLHFSVFNIAAFWYGIVLCQMVFISTDIFATIFLGYAMTLARPAKKLGRERPSSSLLGIQTMVSLLGIWTLNVLFLVAALCFMRDQAGYVQWPALLALEAEWWVLGDNWESSVLFFVVFYQYITCALVYSFGSSFRLGVFYNWAVTGLWVALMTLTTLLLLLPHSGFTHVWHIASEQFNSANDYSPVWEAYREEGFPESPAMSFEFRLKLFALCLGNILVMILWQKFIAEGLGSRALARIFQSKRVKLQM